MSERIRLDIALEHRGLVSSRARGRDAILRGAVAVNGAPASKPGQLVSSRDTVTLDDPASGYVSRAALKLLAGLEAAAIDPADKICLDLGASTGGFTQVLCARGASRVYAVDVGHGQLHADIQALPQVVSLEGTNARDLDATTIPEPIDLLVCDVSFVSLTKIIAAPSALCRSGAQAVLLVKPQFEVGRDHIGKGGIVLDGPHVQQAIDAVILTLDNLGWDHRLSIPSPVKGGDGNTEFIAVFGKR